VPLQVVFVGEARAAQVAAERVVDRVQHHVPLEVVAGRETLVADGADRVLVGMRQDVLVEVAAAREGPVAQVAGVLPILNQLPGVFDKMAWVFQHGRLLQANIRHRFRAIFRKSRRQKLAQRLEENLFAARRVCLETRRRGWIVRTVLERQWPLGRFTACCGDSTASERSETIDPIRMTAGIAT